MASHKERIMEDLTPLYNKELYLAYLCGEDVVLPIPDGNAERYLAYLCGMDVTIPDVPDGRTETYLAYKCGEDVVLPDPMYRIEFYLAKWCGIDCEVPEPMYRIEYWLAQLANSGELKTVTGNPISVSDALAVPAESLTIEILPQQSGSGDPSPDNVRPISGWTGVKVTRTGKNMLDEDAFKTMSNWVRGSEIGGSFGSNASNGCFIIPTVNGQSYTITMKQKDNADTVQYASFCYAAQDLQTSAIVKRFTTDSLANTSISFTATGNQVYYIRMMFSNQSNFDGQLSKVDYVQLELGSATAYEPYTGTTYSLDWTSEAGTVYAISLDVTTGVLTKVPYYASYNGETLVGPWVSSMDKYVSGATPTTGAQVVDLGGTGTDVQLTATEVEMLLGNNTIWNDVDGDMTLEYLADGPADDVDALQILLGNRYVNNGAEDEATDREALDILLGGR